MADPATLDVTYSRSAGASSILTALGAAGAAFAATAWWNEWALPRAVAAYTGDPNAKPRVEAMIANLPAWQRYQPHVIVPWWKDADKDDMSFFYIGLQTPLTAAAGMLGLAGGFQRAREIAVDPAPASTIAREQWDESVCQMQRNAFGSVNPVVQGLYGLVKGEDLRTGANISTKEMSVPQRLSAHSYATVRQVPLFSNLYTAGAWQVDEKL